MAKRTTRGKPTFERVLLGDEELAAKMDAALGAEEREERYTHGFHTYPAGLHPDAARDLLAAFPGDSVLDLFCGGGTVLVEGRVAGRRTLGRDLSPTAIRVARARTASPDDETLTMMRSAARKLTDAAKMPDVRVSADTLRAIGKWYAPHVLDELEVLRRGVNKSDERVRGLLQAIFSSILVKVSWRESDTLNRRQVHRRPKGTTPVLFHKKARELGRRMVALREAIPEGTPESDIRLRDAREVQIGEPVDLVLTSPPYPATYDYLSMQHLRNVWMGDRTKRSEELGSRTYWIDNEKKAMKRWRQGTRQWTAAAANALKPGGHLVIVIGDGLTANGPVDASEATEAAAREAGLESAARASLERPDHARGTSRWEHVFAFKKPS